MNSDLDVVDVLDKVPLVSYILPGKGGFFVKLFAKVGHVLVFGGQVCYIKTVKI